MCEGGDTVSGEAVESEEVKRAKVLEMEAVRAVEGGGSLGDALEILNQAINIAPNYPSPYNNRAQVIKNSGQEKERYTVEPPVRTLPPEDNLYLDHMLLH